MCLHNSRAIFRERARAQKVSRTPTMRQLEELIREILCTDTITCLCGCMKWFHFRHHVQSPCKRRFVVASTRSASGIPCMMEVLGQELILQFAYDLWFDWSILYCSEDVHHLMSYEHFHNALQSTLWSIVAMGRTIEWNLVRVQCITPSLGHPQTKWKTPSVVHVNVYALKDCIHGNSCMLHHLHVDDGQPLDNNGAALYLLKIARQHRQHISCHLGQDCCACIY